MAGILVTGGTTVTVEGGAADPVISADGQTVNVAAHLASGGEINTAANVGNGDAEVYRDKIGSALNFRTIAGTNGITVTENGDVVEVSGSSATNELVAVSAADTTPGYLGGKLVAGDGLTSQIYNPAGDEDFELDVVAHVDGSILVNSDDIQVGVLASDGQHGLRGGGTQHAVAIASGAAGFLAGADKQLIDDLGTTYAPLVHATRHENAGADEISVADLSGLLADAQTPLAHTGSHEGAGSDPITSLGALTLTGTLDVNGNSVDMGTGSITDATDVSLTGGAGSLATHAVRHENGGADEISVAGLSGLLADPQTPATHASEHAGVGGDPITSLGAVTFTGTLDLDGQQLTIDTDGDSYWSHTVDDVASLFLAGSERYKLAQDEFTVTTSLGASGPTIFFGGALATDLKLSRSSNTVLQALLGDGSGYCKIESGHIGINRAPTDTHMLIASEAFAGTGTVIGYGCFPEFAPTSSASNVITSIQGNTWFSTTNWGAGSRVQCLDFYPAPLLAGSTFGSADLDISAINTAGLLNVVGRTITANTITGITLTPITNIFAGTDDTTANIVRGIYISSAITTTGTWGRLCALQIDQQTSGVINQGLAMAGDGIGCDIVFGAGYDANIFYNGSNLVIDPDLVGSGRVLIGTTGDDDLQCFTFTAGGDIDMNGGAGHWLQVPTMTTTERNTMTSGWGASQAGREWYNTTTNQGEAWNGSTIVVRY